jgi:hypothetical protein
MRTQEDINGGNSVLAVLTGHGAGCSFLIALSCANNFRSLLGAFNHQSLRHSECRGNAMPTIVDGLNVASNSSLRPSYLGMSACVATELIRVMAGPERAS